MRMTRAGVMLLSAIGRCQSQTITTPKFEAASIKPCRDGNGGGRGSSGGERSYPGRIDLGCQSVMHLIAMAYVRFGSGHDDPRAQADALRENRIQGGPAWINSVTYQIDAKAEGTPSQDIMKGSMLRALLEERFKLTVHREARETSVYDLTVAKGGPKLQAAKEGGCITIDRDHPPPRLIAGQPLPRTCGGFSGDYMYGTTMSVLCGQFSALLGRRVIDKTGISGAFDIYLDSFLENTRPLAPDGTPIRIDPGAPPPRMDPDDIFPPARAALQKLGLNIESARGPVEFLVIDHVAKADEN